MKDEIAALDLELKELFLDGSFDEMKVLLQKQPDSTVKEISDHNWGIIKKNYDMERFDLIFQHLKFAAFSSFMVEYAHSRQVISTDAFGIMMSIFNDIYEAKRKH